MNEIRTYLYEYLEDRVSREIHDTIEVWVSYPIISHLKRSLNDPRLEDHNDPRLRFTTTLMEELHARN
jgi:hypothetical protein